MIRIQVDHRSLNNTVLLVTDCSSVVTRNCFGGNVMVSVEVDHNKPSKLTVVSLLTVPSALAKDRNWGLFDAHEYKLNLA